jgi:hypothetical protein
MYTYNFCNFFVALFKIKKLKKIFLYLFFKTLFPPFDQIISFNSSNVSNNKRLNDPCQARRLRMHS